MDEITIGDKTYISSKRAAKITGYAKDYVGQLCREGRVEARLVGRNWYVLEGAIRDHRFGTEAAESKETKAPETPAPAPEPVDRSATWQKPQYVAETPAYVPPIAQKEETAAPIGNPALADMQSAWREWFEEKQTAPLAPSEPIEAMPAADNLPEVPETLPAQIEEEAETPVMITRPVMDPPAAPVTLEDVEEAVAIHKSYAARESGEEVPAGNPIADLRMEREESPRTPSRHAGSAAGSNVIRVLLFIVILAALGVAFVGTGLSERFLGTNHDNLGMTRYIYEIISGSNSGSK